MIDRDKTWTAVFLVSANIIFLALLGFVVYLMNWSGPGFALGIGCGALVYLTYFRLKHGYWA